MSDSCREVWWSSHGIELFAVEQGAGTPLVLLHGGMATHQACRLFGAPLAARYRVITPDLRGSGRSRFGGALRWDDLADDLAAPLRHLEVPRAVVGGMSFGAGVAVRFALRHPALVSSLLILHPAYGGAELGLTATQRAAMDAMDAAGSRAPAEGIGVLRPLFEALPPEIRERARALVASYDPASVAASTRFMASGEQPFTRAELATIAVPTLLVPGVDPTHPPEVAAVFREVVPACRVIEGELGTAIARFLAGE